MQRPDSQDTADCGANGEDALSGAFSQDDIGRTEGDETFWNATP